MRHDFTTVSKKLANLKTGEMEYFHVGKHNDPMTVVKGQPSEPTLLNNLKSQKSKAIMDPSLDKTAQAGEEFESPDDK